MKAYAPGKLIISGEYSTIYGKPALAIAINKYLTINISQNNHFCCSLENFNYSIKFTLDDLFELHNTLKQRYKTFTQGKYEIKNIFSHPAELVQFTIAELFKFKSLYKKISAFSLKITSQIPIGCGLGSSAAVILTTLAAISNYHNMSLSKKDYFKLGYEAEKLQHGWPSLLDLSTVFYGGGLYLHKQKMERLELPNLSMLMINTGKPLTSTGECVVNVNEKWSKEKEIWEQFSDTTKNIKFALIQKNVPKLIALIQYNNQLLKNIGVVPQKIQHFIKNIEKTGGAAKICGAGAIKGDNAGIVLALGDTQKILKICEEHGYQSHQASINERGLYVI